MCTAHTHFIYLVCKFTLHYGNSKQIKLNINLLDISIYYDNSKTY